jgi:DNA-binding winged helix-turn-helix (wHTH) protein/TolB-like protein/Tfp pilus assembly protein PilF
MKHLAEKNGSSVYEFGSFRLETTERRLLRDGRPLHLQPKAFDTLLALVQNNGHLLTKDELLNLVWREETFVEENNLTQQIYALRKVLGQKADGQDYIETVPRQGYRFTNEVREILVENNGLIIESREQYHLLIKEETTVEESETTNKVMSFVWTRTFVFAALFLVAAIVVAVWAIKNQSRTSPTFAPQSIAVMPFKAINPVKDDEHIARGISYELSSRLGHIRSVNIRPAGIFNKTNNEPVAITNRLSAEAVLTGEMQREGNQIRVTLRLVDANGVIVWTENLTGDSQNIFALQDAIANKIIAALALELNEKERESLSRPFTSNAEAYELYLKGLYLWNTREGADLHLSTQCFGQAIAKDETFALAYVGLANAYAFDLVHWRKAEETARKALALDSSLGEAHATIGFVKLFWQWNFAEAEREFKRALELNPRYATAHQWYALWLAAHARKPEAIAEMQEALELDPLSPSINADLAQLFYFKQDYDKAIEQARRTLEIDPNFYNAHLYLYQTYTMNGMYDEAVAECETAEKIANSSNLNSRIERLRQAYETSGIRRLWQEQINIIHNHPLTEFRKARYYALLGDKERAIDWLEKSYENHNLEQVFILSEPAFEKLHNDPRFDFIIKRMNFVNRNT